MKFITLLRLSGISLGILFGFSDVCLAVETSRSKELTSTLKYVVELHPLVQSAKEKLNQASADTKSSDQPLYNPELSIDYESNVENTSTLGVSQTIDLSDKRSAFAKIGRRNFKAAEAQLVITRQQVAAGFLNKVNEYQTAQLASSLNSQQISTIDQFTDIAKRRFKVGDISQIELDLTLLVAGELRMNSARIQAEFYTAETELNAFSNFEEIDLPKLTVQQIQIDSSSVEQLLLGHPRLRQLRLATEAAKAQIKLADRQSSADPTVSFSAGKEGDESIYNLGFSMPLFVRNNFSAEIDSAIANAAAIEQDYRNNYRDILVTVKSSRKKLSLTFDAYKNWVKQSQSGLQQRGQLLQRLWKSGDLSTTDYLVQIQQTLNTQISATQLKADVIDAWIEYLLASGQIDKWLSLS